MFSDKKVLIFVTVPMFVDGMREGIGTMRQSVRLTVVVTAIMLFCHLATEEAKSSPATGKADKAKNIIFMVPDGMSLSGVTAARVFKNGCDGEPLHLETLPQIGYQRTHSADSTVTDSAAATSAWACGEKYRNGEISCHDDDGDGQCNDPVIPTILEMAKQEGKATGLVVTSTITHATPAAWGAHVHSRKCETEIARQYIEKTGIDVLLGGGIGPDKRSSCQKPSPIKAADLIAKAQSDYGYTYVTTKSGLDKAAQGEKSKVLGIFRKKGKTPETYRVDRNLSYPKEEPTLPHMTAAALDILEKDRDGFFLMVEGSQIDWANHANDIRYQIGEALAFDEAVKVVLDWIEKHPQRKTDTLLVIVADHDCGGFAVNGPHGRLLQAGEVVDAGWTSPEHTGVDTVIWSYGPGSQKLGRALDNTDLFKVMTGVLH
jgi:alkaline phosphatase